MKKITVIIFCLMALYTQAQNTFPATGNVGIGTTSPSSALHVKGDLTVESKIYGPGRLHVSGEEFLHILNRKGVVIGREWGGNGNLSVQGSATIDVGLQIGSGAGVLHAGGGSGLLLKPSTGDRALMELHSPDGANRLVLQSLSGASYLSSLDGKPLALQPVVGNVGIGTANPEENLTVAVPASSSPIKAMSIDVGSFRTVDNLLKSYYFRCRDLGNGYIPFYIRGDGNVGIGTANPNHPLHIRNTNLFLANFENTSSGVGAATDAFVLFSNKYGQSQISSWQNFGTRIGSRSISAEGLGNVYFTTGNDIIRMIIQEKNGNVGIGTENPTQKLSVNGTIQAKEIIVNTGWSDFVFDNNYKLRPLTEVEQFVKTNKHLPEIPSQKEVEKNGVQLGDISSKLLMKIEELTLYIIEMKKEIQILQKENAALKTIITNPKN